jgi:hypothetical protein
VHGLLDPKAVAGPTSPFAGKVMREVVVSDEHPNPTPIAIVLDVTGSNFRAAEVVHRELANLFERLQSVCSDPQINVCAVGDAYSDEYPLQVGQFESDIRVAKQLEAMILEGNGGGQMCETYELAAYFLARHTNPEPFDRQGRKGFVFFMGDEMPYDVVRSKHVKQLVGQDLEADISTKQIFQELQERYEVFFLFQKQGAYREAQILPTWRDLLGERALVLDRPEDVCQMIAEIIEKCEAANRS